MGNPMEPPRLLGADDPVGPPASRRPPGAVPGR